MSANGRLAGNRPRSKRRTISVGSARQWSRHSRKIVFGESGGAWSNEYLTRSVAQDGASPTPLLEKSDRLSSDGRADAKRLSSVEDGGISWALSKAGSPS